MFFHISLHSSFPGLVLVFLVSCVHQVSIWVGAYWWHSEHMFESLPSAHLNFLGDSVCSYSNVQLDVEIVFLQNMLISNTVRELVHVRRSACMNRTDCCPLCSSIT